MEFGVAPGGGLMNMCWIAEKVSRETRVKFDIIGLDSGEGMPPPSSGTPSAIFHRSQCISTTSTPSTTTCFAVNSLAIEDFDKSNELRKIAPMNFLSKWRIFKNAIWHGQIYFAHIFDHEFRSLEYVKAQRAGLVHALSNPFL